MIVLQGKLKQKLLQLQKLIRMYQSVGVAVSGGVDSTLMLKVAVDVLGEENVTAYHISSEFTSPETEAQVKALFDDQIFSPSLLKTVQFYLLPCKEIIKNCQDRCYYCKRRMYMQLLHECVSDQRDVLFDGLNLDDLKQERAGLRAIHELYVKTPFIDARIGKDDVRKLAKYYLLPNHDLPSDSCLAARVQAGKEITDEDLRQVAEAECFLQQNGFLHCKVKPEKDYIIIQAKSQDMVRLIERSNRLLIQHKFTHLGFGKVLLDFEERG